MECTFPCPEIGEGWTQKIVKRKNSSIESDRYFFPPNDEGKRFRSMVEVNRYLNGNAVDGKTKTTATTATTSPRKPPTKVKARTSKSSPAAAPKVTKSTTKTPKYPIGTTLSKMFRDEYIGKKRPFQGTVTKYDSKRGLYWVRYDDGDEEELSENKLSDLVEDDPMTVESSKRYPLGTLVSKVFRDDDGHDRAFSGKVVEYDTTRNLYSITYEDGDEEEVTEKELRMIVVDDDDGDNNNMDEVNGVGKKEQIKRKGTASKESEGNIAIMKKPRTSKSENGDSSSDTKKEDAFEMLMSKTPRRAAKKKVVYAEESDLDEEEFEDSADDEVLPKKRAKKSGTAGKKKAVNKVSKDKRKRIIESDSDEFEPDHEVEDVDESFDADSESDMEASSEEEEEVAPRKRNRNKPASSSKKRASTKASSNNGAKKSAVKNDEKFAPDSIEALCAAKAKDIKLLNNPQQFPEDGPYVEPVGIDATDGIVEGIIGGMVQKVGELLLETIKRNDAERELGELSFPIKLNTACSGTDAPSIALGLVKESLDRFCPSERSLGGEASGQHHVKGHGFDYEHNMSCEIEPFKQAYIGRNFPGVLLFPDITKLTEKETVVDVYGRAQKIPKGERKNCYYALAVLSCSKIVTVSHIRQHICGGHLLQGF